MQMIFHTTWYTTVQIADFIPSERNHDWNTLIAIF